MKKFLIALSLVLTLFASNSQASVISEIQGLDLVSGQTKSIQIDSEKQTVLIFMSPVCPCSQSHESIVEQLQKSYPNVNFIGIHSNANEPLDLAQKHFHNKFSFPVIRDAESKIADQLGALKTPHAFIIKNSEIVYSGGIDNSHIAEKATKPYLQIALSQLAQGKNPEPKQVRTLGCVIQRP